jgi:hypothetical protein
MRYHSTDVAANEAPDRHWRAIFPVHITLQYEHEDRHSSHAKGQKVFERDHMPDIASRDKTQRADHEDANPGSKIAAIQCHQENARNCHRPQCHRDVGMYATAFVASNQNRPQYDDNSGD